MTDLTKLGGVEAGRLIREKKLSPVELTEAYLARIERLDPRLHAYAHVMAEPARSQAKEREQEVLKRAQEIDDRESKMVPHIIKNKSLRKAIEIFRAAGYLVFAPSIEQNYHSTGTARMGRDAATSVVNADCKSHDVDGLFVVDSSVLPTSGALNSGLTIAAPPEGRSIQAHWLGSGRAICSLTTRAMPLLSSLKSLPLTEKRFITFSISCGCVRLKS